VLQRDPDITAASVIDDSELSELLRQDANQQRQDRAARVGAAMATGNAAQPIQQHQQQHQPIQQQRAPTMHQQPRPVQQQR